MQTVEEFARRAVTLPALLVETTPNAVRAAGAVLETAVRASVSAATGGDNRLSGVRSGSVITLDVEVRGAGASATSVVVPKGPIMLVEENTRRHGEPFQYKVNRRVKKRGKKRIAFGGKVYAHVDHPGTKGRHPVRNAFESAHEHAGREGVLVFARAARQHLTGGGR